VLIDPGIALNTQNPKKPPAPVHSRLGKLSYTNHFLTILYKAAPYGPLYVLINPGKALKGHGNEADFLGFLQRRVRESFFDYEYLCEFEAKFGTARKVV
jgi:hypothetical protein